MATTKLFGKAITSISILAMLATIGSFILPLVLRYVDRAELTLYCYQPELMLEKRSNLDGIRVTYNGENVSRMLRYKFTLKNTGGQGLAQADFIRPLELSFVSPFLDAKIDPTVSKEIKDSFELLPNKNDNSLTLMIREHFLKNEEISFSLFTSQEFSQYPPTHRLRSETINSVSIKAVNGSGEPNYKTISIISAIALGLVIILAIMGFYKKVFIVKALAILMIVFWYSVCAVSVFQVYIKPLL